MKPYYEQDNITIYHGDCRDVVPNLHERFDLLLTDPPYGLGDKWAGGKAKWPLHHGQMDWDAETVDFLPWLIQKAVRSIVWGGHLYGLGPERGWLIWDKIVREFTSGHCELAWTNLDQPIRAFNFSHGQLATEGKFHPTQKPIALMEWCIKQAGNVTEILDPFAGVGTTGVAAKLNGKRATLIEVNERYCEIAAKRLAQGVLFGAEVA
jgi:site-specific DNA-methyltransferase (adenine-specific)